ncbi:hypothetical protein [Nodosilinea sp. FACHB-13]|nr:hypothetical protein [Nodosilinea sp. FACHB-13]MBD2106699.1 hypothetical protein [Nodosilinea sp. FACHB-13]
MTVLRYGAVGLLIKGCSAFPVIAPDVDLAIAVVFDGHTQFTVADYR